VREGFLYVWHWPGMLLLVLVFTLSNSMICPASSLLPLLVIKHFGGAAWHLGWMNSAWGIGVILGGLIFSAWRGFRRRIVTAMVGLLGMGLSFLLVGLAPAPVFWLAVGAMLLAGTTNSITNVPIYALLQSVVAPEMQGRVFMIGGSLVGLAAPLSLAIAGPVADVLGSGVWFIFSGATCILMGVVSFFVPVILNIEEQRTAPAGPPSAAHRPRSTAGAADAAPAPRPAGGIARS
jgi:DHA3 family macrolide efflux protein-like MFS transporter